eukprot:113718_1
MAGVLSWSAITSIVYFTAYLLLLLFIAYKVRSNNYYDGIKGFFKAIWAMRSVYAAVLVHLYDTATDVGVMVDWWFLAKDEQMGEEDYESLDMTTMFYCSVSFLILYRIIHIVMVAVSEIGLLMDRQSRIANKIQYSFYLLLAFFDMYIVKTVYVAIKKGKTEPTPRQRLTQLIESIFESLPQILLQAVFIIRGFNDEQLKKNSSVLLVLVSLISSVFSVTNKYIWLDKRSVTDDSKDTNLSTAFPFINLKWILRCVWRFAIISIRFTVLSLTWVVFGGGLLPIYVFLSFIYWLIYYRVFERSLTFMQLLSLSTIAIASNMVSQKLSLFIFRISENILLMIALNSWAYNKNDSCYLCTKSEFRQATQNVYILLFIVIGWIAIVADITSSLIIHVFKYFHGNSSKSLDGLQNALDDVEVTDLNKKRRSMNQYYLSFYITNLDGLTYKEITSFNMKHNIQDYDKLCEDLQDVFQFKSKSVNAKPERDFYIDPKESQIFKYGISIKCAQYIDSSIWKTRILCCQYSKFEETGSIRKYINELYGTDSQYYHQIIGLFKKHFNVDMETDFEVKCTEKMFGFLMLKKK